MWISQARKSMTTLNIVRSGNAFSSLATVFHQNLYRFTLRSPISWINSTTFGVAHRKSTNVDALDIFTTHILSKKSSTPNKMPTESLDTERKLLKQATTSEILFDTKVLVNIDNWNQSEIDNYLNVSINCGDRKTFDEIIEQMLKLKRLPSEAVILQVLCHLCDAHDNSMLTISRLIDLCQDINVAFYAKNVEFAPFLSQYLWKLERYDDAMNTLNAIYNTTNKISKSLILRNYRQIVYDAVKNQDECVLNKLIQNAIQLNNKFTDPTLINFIWSDCFFSELFRNQIIANELFSTYAVIRETVSKDIGWIALTLLQQHNVDAMQRLIELCLAAHLKREVGICLTALFDYHYWRHDLRACSEIMNTSLRLGTTISKSQNQKLLNLLLKKKQKPPQSSDKSTTVKTTSSRFEFKF